MFVAFLLPDFATKHPHFATEEKSFFCRSLSSWLNDPALDTNGKRTRGIRFRRGNAAILLSEGRIKRLEAHRQREAQICISGSQLCSVGKGLVLAQADGVEFQRIEVELDCSEEAIACVLRYMGGFTVELPKLAEHVLEVNYYELKKLATMCVSAVQHFHGESQLRRRFA